MTQPRSEAGCSPVPLDPLVGLHGLPKDHALRCMPLAVGCEDAEYAQAVLDLAQWAGLHP